MEKQIVLREPIVWEPTWNAIEEGYIQGHFVASIHRKRGTEKWYVFRIPGGKIRESEEMTKDEAKAKAEQILTDWLRSIATITE